MTNSAASTSLDGAPAGAAAIPHARLMRIGDLAQAADLSLRTIRYYEDVGLVSPCERTPGGFRLYSHEAVERLLIIKAMKPLGFQLDQMGELIEAVRRTDQRRSDGLAALEEDLATVRRYYPEIEYQIDKALTNLVSARQLTRRLIEQQGIDMTRHEQG